MIISIASIEKKAVKSSHAKLGQQQNRKRDTRENWLEYAVVMANAVNQDVSVSRDFSQPIFQYIELAAYV
jgi:hypothetical protein